MNKIIPEYRKIDNENYWKRIKNDGTIEYYSKDYYNDNYERKEKEIEKLLKEIENEMF
jgi:hypothetical protein